MTRRASGEKRQLLPTAYRLLPTRLSPIPPSAPIGAPSGNPEGADPIVGPPERLPLYTGSLFSLETSYHAHHYYENHAKESRGVEKNLRCCFAMSYVVYLDALDFAEIALCLNLVQSRLRGGLVSGIRALEPGGGDLAAW